MIESLALWVGALLALAVASPVLLDFGSVGRC